jgi:hypothetical protein
MATQKKLLTVASIFFTLIALGVFLPGLAIGSVLLGTADFGEVPVGSTGSIPLYITNTGKTTVILYFSYENYGCGFSLPRQESVLQPGATLDLEITWTPPEGSEDSTCSDTLKVIYGPDLYETVLVMGRAVAPSGGTRGWNPNIFIGECDTGVVDRSYEGKLISEWIRGCADGVKNHGQFVRCVAGLTNDLKKAGIISGKEKDRIQSTAAQANIPR